MESKHSECNNFVPQKTIPLFKVADHTELQSKWQEEVRKHWEKYVPTITNTEESSLVVVFPNDQWLANENKEIKPFLYAPRKNAQVESIDSKWQDKRLEEFMYQLWHNTALTALVLRSGKNSAVFEEYPELHLYCLMNSKPNDGSIKTKRQDIINGMRNIKFVDLKGLKDISNNSENMGYLIHLQLDRDFTPIIPVDPINDSNYFVWLSFDAGGVVSESILVTSFYVWNTFMDIAWKHDRILSKEYNLNIDIIDDYYNGAHQVEMKSNERVSHVTPNQMIEMDTLWNNFTRHKWQVKSGVTSVSLDRAVGVLVANRHYERWIDKYFPINKFGFEKVFTHYYDRWKSFTQRYQASKQTYKPLFVGLKVSCNRDLLRNIAPKWAERIVDAFVQLRGSCGHIWLPKYLDYSNMRDDIKEKIMQYMKDLQKDFQLQQTSDVEHINSLCEAMQECLPQYLSNKWCLSLYRGNQCAHISRLYIDEFKPRLCFGNGFELLLVYQDNKFPLVFVDSFMWQCQSSCTAIQFHSRGDLKNIHKGIRVKGYNDSTVVALFRVVPVVHSEKGLLMYDDSGKMCQRHNECGWIPSASNK